MKTLLASFAWRALAVCLACLVCSCTYLRYASVQAEYARIQAVEPGQLNVKHMIDRETYFVYGRVFDAPGSYAGLPKAIAAFSSKYRANERVDLMHFEVAGTHFGLTLPQGEFALLVFADIDGDGVFGPAEVVGQRLLELDRDSAPDKVLGHLDLQLADPVTLDWQVAIAVPDRGGRAESLFYPSGTIRRLDDPIFDRSFATLGMYDPASFLEQAPTMFYALEEDRADRIPVVFVHGIDGSARDFGFFVDQLDRERYKAWFFHYPSGGDLGQLAELFYRIFLSGEVYRSDGMPMIIVAHSMGGLVVREALNKYRGAREETPVQLFVSIGTPFGGHAAAAAGERRGLIVLPSWRGLNPDSPFIGGLYRKPLPGFVRHELIYVYRNPGAVKIGDNSDGVVSLASQLYPQAQRQASGQFGFDVSHTGSLASDAVFAHIRSLMTGVPNKYPPAQLRLLRAGGYDVALGEAYSPMARYLIHTYGKYLMALGKGAISPSLPGEERFVAVVNGERAPGNDEERAWLRFLGEYPEFAQALDEGGRSMELPTDEIQ